jgi:hypothetical protein
MWSCGVVELAEGHDGQPVGSWCHVDLFFYYFSKLFAESQTVLMAHLCRGLNLRVTTKSYLL